METLQLKKAHKGGNIVQTKPVDMHLFDTEPMARECFEEQDVSLSAKTCRETTQK
jgi:hypothetical protein